MLVPEIGIFVHAGLSARWPSGAVPQVIVGGDPEDAEDGEAYCGLAPPAPAQVVVNHPLGQTEEAVGQKAWRKGWKTCISIATLIVR